MRCCGSVVWPWLSSFESPAHPVKSLTSTCPAPGAHSKQPPSVAAGICRLRACRVLPLFFAGERSGMEGPQCAYLPACGVAVPRRITQDDYDKKARELKEQQAEIATRIEQHQQGNAEYRTTLESLISLASRAAELFERSKTEQKRQLIAFVFSNLRLKGKKLEFSLRSPFDLMVDRATYPSWLPFLDTYRTMCLAPEPPFRRALEEIRAWV